MPTVSINGTILSYLVAGDGPPVFLLLRGAGGGILGSLSDLFDRLATVGQVVAMEWRGADDPAPEAAAFTLETLAADARALLDHLAVPRALVVGHAYGGRVAQVFARDYPDNTEAVVLVANGGQFPPLAVHGVQYLADPSLDRGTWERAYLADFASEAFAREQPVRARQVLDRRWEERRARVNEPALVAQLVAAAMATPSPTYWGKFGAPALLLYGRDDKYGHPQNAVDLAERLPGAKLVMIENAGHLLPAEHPDRVFAEITQFVGTLPPRSS